MQPLFKRIAAIAVLTFAVALVQSHPAPAAAAQTDLSCGIVDLGTTSSADLEKAFDCFNTAFAHCDPATLVATSSDAVDANTSTFATFTGDRGCAVSETVERSTGNAKTVDSYICQGVDRAGNALHFYKCGSQKDVSLTPSTKH